MNNQNETDIKARFSSLTPINAGWSGDEKYLAEDVDGKKFFLRITPEEKAEKAKNSFGLQKKFSSLGIDMCVPLECGYCKNGFYILQSWIDGENAERIIKNCPEEKQYSLGYEAGSILKKLHTVPAPEEAENWETRFNAKIDRKIKMYNECPVKIEGGELFLDYIEKSRHLLKGRPQTYQHGDYHIGNMMIERGKIVIIDFDRFDYGDPWEEFNRIVWSAQASPRFASGTVDGYFDGQVPQQFWRLLALYISSNALSSVPWAIPFGDAEVKRMLDQSKTILGWYDGMTKEVPEWYEK